MDRKREVARIEDIDYSCGRERFPYRNDVRCDFLADTSFIYARRSRCRSGNAGLYFPLGCHVVLSSDCAYPVDVSRYRPDRRGSFLLIVFGYIQKGIVAIIKVAYPTLWEEDVLSRLACGHNRSITIKESKGGNTSERKPRVWLLPIGRLRSGALPRLLFLCLVMRLLGGCAICCRFVLILSRTGPTMFAAGGFVTSSSKDAIPINPRKYLSIYKIKHVAGASSAGASFSTKCVIVIDLI